MKSSAFLLLVFLCLTGVSWQNLESSSTPASPTAQAEPPSPFALKSKLPEGCFLSKVVPSGNNDPTCQGLWNRTGYICDKNVLGAWATEDKNYIINTMPLFKNSLTMVAEIAKKIQDSTIQGFSLSESEVAILKRHQDTSIHGAKQANAEQCANALIRVRNSALCSLCSAENYRFFSDDKRGYMPYCSCQAFLTECNAHFTDLASFFNDLPLLLRIDKFFNPLGNVMNDVMQKEFTAGVERTMRMATGVSSSILQLAAANSEEAKEPIRRSLCQLMISLTEKPGIIWSLRMMNFNLFFMKAKIDGSNLISAIKSGDILGAIKSGVAGATTLGKAITQAVPQTTTSIPKISVSPLKGLFSNWRKLQTTDEYTDFMMSFPTSYSSEVIIVKPTDSMFTSFEGADGTSLSHENSCKKIMNMSICFP